jgi:hypothetical protein
VQEFPGSLETENLLESSCSMHVLDLSTNPKLWDLILPRDLREWETEFDLIDTL